MCKDIKKKLHKLRVAIEHGEVQILAFFEEIFHKIVKKGIKDKKKMKDKSYRITPRALLKSLA